MSAVEFHKVSALPGVLRPNALYFVANGAYAETWLTDTAGAAKAVGNSDMIAAIGGGSSAIVYPAGENISALRAVFIDGGQAFKADRALLGEAAGVIGVTISSALIGANVSVQTSGVMTDGGWNWATAPNPTIYLGVDGALTQTYPATGFGREVATALSATSIFINPRSLIAI